MALNKDFNNQTNTFMDQIQANEFLAELSSSEASDLQEFIDDITADINPNTPLPNDTSSDEDSDHSDAKDENEHKCLQCANVFDPVPCIQNPDAMTKYCQTCKPFPQPDVHTGANNVCIHCRKDAITDPSNICDNCVKKLDIDPFRRYLDLDIEIMAIDDSGAYQRCAIHKQQIGSKKNPFACVIFEDKLDDDGNVKEMWDGESTWVHRARIEDYRRNLIGAGSPVAKKLVDNLPAYGSVNAESETVLKSLTIGDMLMEFMKKGSEANLFLNSLIAGQKGAQGSNGNDSNSKSDVLLKDIQQTQLMEEAVFKGTYPKTKVQFFKYIADVNQYYLDFPAVEPNRLFRSIRKKASQLVRNQFHDWKQIKFRTLVNSVETGETKPDRTKFNKSLENKTEWIRFTMEQLCLKINKLDFSVYENVFIFCKDERPTLGFDRISNYMRQLRTTIDTLNGLRKFQIKQTSDAANALIMYESIVNKNNSIHYGNKSKLNSKVSMKIENKYYELEYSMDILRKELKKIETNLISNNSNTSGEKWVAAHNCPINVFCLDPHKFRHKVKAKDVPKKPWKPWNKRGKGNINLSLQQQNKKGWTDPCPKGKGCQWLKKGACRRYHPSSDSNVNCTKGSRCKPFQYGHCNKNHDKMAMNCDACNARGHGKSECNKLGNKPNANAYNRYSPFKKPNADSSYANINKTKKAKAMAIKAAKLREQLQTELANNTKVSKAAMMSKIDTAIEKSGICGAMRITIDNDMAVDTDTDETDINSFITDESADSPMIQNESENNATLNVQSNKATKKRKFVTIDIDGNSKVPRKKQKISNTKSILKNRQSKLGKSQLRKAMETKAKYEQHMCDLNKVINLLSKTGEFIANDSVCESLGLPKDIGPCPQQGTQ